MKKHKITKEKLEKLQSELTELETVERKEIADRLNRNRNATTDELDTSISELLDEKNAIERRITEIKQIIANHEIIKKCNSKKIEVGATVEVKSNGRKNVYQIVESMESDPMNGKISEQSPIGKALLGHKKGDVVKVKIRETDCEYLVENVCYK
jgi:transcription elongation factor GreA